MDRVGDLLDPALRSMGVRRRVREAQLREAFTSLLGPALAPLCRVTELNRGTLVVATAHTALAHQLQLDSTGLLESLNTVLGEPVIRRLRFTPLGELGEPPAAADTILDAGFGDRRRP